MYIFLLLYNKLLEHSNFKPRVFLSIEVLRNGMKLKIVYSAE